MAWSIQRVPSGLLSLFGIKGAGQNPNALGEQVGAVCNVVPFYACDLIQQRSTIVTGLGAVGGAATLTVPDNEAWRLISLGWSLTNLAAADLASIQLAITAPSTGSLNCPVFYVPPRVVVANEQVHAGFLVPQELIIPPGSLVFASIIATIASANASLRVRAMIHVLER